jgi:uncharacterized membrane protein YdjX (TVP38/TMEM64 family)
LAGGRRRRVDVGVAAGCGMKVHIALLALLAVTAVLAYHHYPVQDWLHSFIITFRGLGAPGVVLFMATYVLLALLMVPGAVLTLAAAPLYGIFWGYVVVASAALLAISAAFALSKGLLRRRVESWAEEHPLFRAVNAAVSRQGAFVAFLMRLSPVIPFSVINYYFGVTRVRFPTYLLASWLGMVPGTLFYVYLGKLGTDLAEAREGVGAVRIVLLSAGLLATVAVTCLIAWRARRMLRESRASGDGAGAA